jgi:Zn ribbon nucleic-acid-binding protein
MFKRHTQYKFQSVGKCPACQSADTVDFETTQNVKIMHISRCLSCDFEIASVYALSDADAQRAKKYTLTRYVHDEKNKWVGEPEPFGQPEDKVLFST